MMESGRSSIENLLYRYAELIDSGDFNGIGELFSHAVLTGEGSQEETRGAEAIARRYRATTRIYTDTGTPKTKHLITNLAIEVDEDAGSGLCRSCYTVFQRTDTLPLQPIISGRYHSRFERLNGVWRFARHHFLVDLVGDLSQHLLIDIEEAKSGRI